MKIKLILIGIAALAFTGCKKILDADPENLKDIDAMYTDGSYAQGFVVTAYRSIPGYYDNSDYATDDAVTNQRTNNFLQLATGSWTAANNPVSVWTQAYAAMQYLNLFLERSDKVFWANDQEANKLFNMRMRGEAFGLRGLYMYYLLRAHGGIGEDGQLLGVPIITELKTIESDVNVPRATFEACVKQIYKDLDSAEVYLPLEYNDVTNVSQIADRFKAITQRTDVYNRVMGAYSRQLFNGLIAKSFRARTALLAASPAFQNASNTTTWANAAEYAGAIIDYKGGVGALPATGVTYYTNKSEIDNLSGGSNAPEIIWRENVATNESSQETANFPPSLFGSGNMNPTQNLVESFPMANGYPITHANSNFNPASPYAGRDPRLNTYIVFNGASMGEGAAARVITTGSKSATDDGINKREISTRTGYYMRKRLRMDVNRNPASITQKNHVTPRLRYTEFYLAYAEAANEAWGPTGVGTRPYSAYDVIKRIRTRAGVGTTNGDAYLEECKADKNKMRDLIRNERRLELCFESFRFWDIRRWKANLTAPARGLDVNPGSIAPLEVENRSYADYQYYGPIPFSEILKFNNLKQNRGWK
jgi:hypothetical protein